MAFTISRFTTSAAAFDTSKFSPKEQKALRIYYKAGALAALGGNNYITQFGFTSTIIAGNAPLLQSALTTVGGLDNGRIVQASVGSWSVASSDATAQATVLQKMQGLRVLSDRELDLCELYITAVIMQAAGLS